MDTLPDVERAAITVNLGEKEFALVKAAYLGAFHDLGGDADTVPRWVALALHEHARRTTSQRRALHTPYARAEDPAKPRRFVLPADAVQAMRHAASQDRTTAHDDGPLVLSESAWARDAITAHVADITATLADRGITLTPVNDPLPRGRLRR